MRSMTILMAAAWAVAGAAMAADDSDTGAYLITKPGWTIAPSAADVAAAYPKRAKGGAGQATLRCWVGSGGLLQECNARSESPKGEGFGAAARSLAPKFRVMMDGIDPAARGAVMVDVPVAFAPAGQAHVVTNPEWLKTLPPERMQEVFPPKAADAGLATGRAVVDCTADAKGALSGCQVVSEDPAGMDFGPAALRVAQVMAVNPWTEDGHAADGAHVRFALRLNKAN